MKGRPYFDTEPDDPGPDEPEPVVTHAEPPSPAGRCCMCGVYGEPLFHAQFCEVRRPDGGYSYGPGLRCSDLRACRERREAE